MNIFDIFGIFDSHKRRKIFPIINSNKRQLSLSSTEFRWSGRPTATYHWWPMRETERNGDDPCNNLYSKRGGLDKYDELFGTSSIAYQKKKYFRKYNSKKKDAHWAGFCDLATTLSCLYVYPKYDVSVMCDSIEQTFTPKDIEALMIVSCNNATQRSKSIFYGERNNGYDSNDMQEPYPTKLLSILTTICNDNVPFAMDIEADTAVWNYSFDKVRISRYNKKPLSLRMNVDVIPQTGKTEYLLFIINSKAYPKKVQTLWGWINYSHGIKTEGWLTKQHPDFIWKKYKKNTEWVGNSHINPEIDTNIVYKIYQHSLHKNANILVVT